MLTTKELIERLFIIAKIHSGAMNENLNQAGQRLRELDIENKQLEAVYATDGREFTRLNELVLKLDKPDCIYTRCADDSPTPNTLESGCGDSVLWYLGDDGKGDYPKFCHHCGGAVKEAT